MAEADRLALRTLPSDHPNIKPFQQTYLLIFLKD